MALIGTGKQPDYDENMRVRFAMKDSKTDATVVCTISGEALQDRFSANIDGPLAAFHFSRSEIENAASRLYRDDGKGVSLTNASF
ncbi:DUF1488 family protein [Ancylobacter sp.]|uniref:DUF1488 family protein n=1 Tax=Ancylobacter sp. TaxID=1872567 RepID=UPI003D0CE89B